MADSKVKKIESKRFWRDIVYKGGKLDEKAVMAELSDYYAFLEEVPKVYDAVSGGRISKPNTKAFEVIREFEEQFESKSITKDDVIEMLKSCDDFEELKNELQNYFDIDDEEISPEKPPKKQKKSRS